MRVDAIRIIELESQTDVFSIPVEYEWDNSFFAYGMATMFDYNMLIFIKTHKDDKIAIYVEPSDSVKDLKTRLQEKVGVPFDQQKLIFGCKWLRDDKNLSDFNIQNKSVIHTVIRVIGGCFLPEAPITLSDGSTKMIKDLEDGDSILTYNTKTMTLESRRMSGLTSFQVDYLCEIDFGNQKLISTPNHSFWIPDKKEWRAVWPHPNSSLQPLKVGDYLLSSDLKSMKIEAIKIIRLETMTNVYCMHVDEQIVFLFMGC